MDPSAGATFDAALARAAAFDEALLARPWSYLGRPIDVRYAFYRTVEDAQEALMRVAARPHPESRRILALAQRAFGDLRGLLVGLPDDLLDRAPREAEWPLRETLRHVLLIERRYATQTRWATERTAADPIRIGDDRMPTPAQIDVTGSVGQILTRLGEVRAETNRGLGDLTPAAITRPSAWMGYEVDVRFRLHRFPAHLIEHTIQCEKTLDALGWRPPEGRYIVRRLASLLGEIEGLGGESEARDIEREFVARLAST